jgi:hypothetical protein
VTVSHIGPLIAALKEQLTTALIEGGVAEDEGGAAPDVPVFTEVTEDQHRIYVRIEAGSMLQGNSNVGHADRHVFLVRVVHENMGEAITDPVVELPRVAGLIVDALKKWAPLEVSDKIKFISSFPTEEPNPAVHSRVCRFSVNIFGD